MKSWKIQLDVFFKISVFTKCREIFFGHSLFGSGSNQSKKETSEIMNDVLKMQNFHAFSWMIYFGLLCKENILLKKRQFRFNVNSITQQDIFVLYVK